MAEWKQLISEWLNEYASLQENEIKSFAAEHEHNHEIATAIFNLLYSDEGSETHLCNKIENDVEYEKILEEVCTQLFSFYRSKESELQRFTLQFVPTLIHNYLSLAAKGSKRTYRCIETLLIGLYNFEVVDETGKPKVVSFRLPSLAQASIYHEPMSLGPQFLTESALRRWEECNTKLVSWGPLPQVENINAQNRLKVMAALLFIYNRHLSLLPKLSFRHFCIAASRIVTQGFSKETDKSCCSSSRPTPRIPVAANFLLEMIEGAYFAMFNEFYTLALQAIKDIDQRAQYELLPDVMLVTSAVINSLANNESGQPFDGPLGISVALSPATNTVTMSKSMITNASFRTKKLPDDIPIQAGQVVPTEAPDTLTSITEEGETDTAMQRGVVSRNSKPKMSAFPVLGKKTKEAKEKALNEKKVVAKDSKAIWNSLSGGGDSVEAQQKVNASDSPVDMNGSVKDDKLSSTSGLNSTENSDSRSQVTTDSMEMETAPRFAAMQVSSV